MVDTRITDIDEIKKIFKWVYICRSFREYQWLYIYKIHMNIYEYIYYTFILHSNINYTFILCTYMLMYIDICLLIICLFVYMNINSYILIHSDGVGLTQCYLREITQPPESSLVDTFLCRGKF